MIKKLKNMDGFDIFIVGILSLYASEFNMSNSKGSTKTTSNPSHR